jgi:hypothetical protein
VDVPLIRRPGTSFWGWLGRGALLVPVLAVLAGCGGGGGHAAARAGLGRLNGAVVDFYLPATGQQLSAGMRYFIAQSHVENAMAFRCMAGHSFSPQARPLVRYTELYMDPLLGSPQLAGWGGENMSGIPDLYNLAGLEQGGLLAEILAGSPPPPPLPAAKANALYEYYFQCQNRAAVAFARISHDGGLLAAQWLRMVSAVQATTRVRAAYAGFTACSRRSGVPAKAATSPDSFRNWLADKVTPPMPDPYGHKALISAEVRTDRQWTAVFISCVKPVLPLLDRLQLAARTAFLTAHYQQVLSLQQLADRVLSSLIRRYHPGSAA